MRTTFRTTGVFEAIQLIPVSLLMQIDKINPNKKFSKLSLVLYRCMTSNNNTCLLLHALPSLIFLESHKFAVLTAFQLP